MNQPQQMKVEDVELGAMYEYQWHGGTEAGEATHKGYFNGRYKKSEGWVKFEGGRNVLVEQILRPRCASALIEDEDPDAVYWVRIYGTCTVGYTSRLEAAKELARKTRERFPGNADDVMIRKVAP